MVSFAPEHARPRRMKGGGECDGNTAQKTPQQTERNVEDAVGSSGIIAAGRHSVF